MMYTLLFDLLPSPSKPRNFKKFLSSRLNLKKLKHLDEDQKPVLVFKLLKMT